jgi:hypothetical protein
MTKAMLIRRLAAVVVVIVGLVAAAVLGRLFGGAPGMVLYEIITDFTELQIALIAVYLAYVFQQRALFVQMLRGLWSQIIVAKNEIIRYAHDPHLSQEKYARAFGAISLAIDEMRGVYRNVGEHGDALGRYPYEPLQDMARALTQLGYGEPSDGQRANCRARVIRAWNALRYDFRREFRPPEPSHPITEPYAADPRRDSSGDPPPPRSEKRSTSKGDAEKAD